MTKFIGRPQTKIF